MLSDCRDVERDERMAFEKNIVKDWKIIASPFSYTRNYFLARYISSLSVSSLQWIILKLNEKATKRKIQTIDTNISLSVPDVRD